MAPIPPTRLEDIILHDFSHDVPLPKYFVITAVNIVNRPIDSITVM